MLEFFLGINILRTVVLDEATPHNYSILINDELADSGLWDGSDITHEFSWSNLGEVQATLILYDGSGNRAEDSVIIEIRPIPSTTPTTTLSPPSTTLTTSTPASTSTTPTTAEMNYPVLALLTGITLALVWHRRILRKR